MRSFRLRLSILAGGLLAGLLLWPGSRAAGACFTNSMMQGQDPMVEYKDGYYHLAQSDGCNIHLRRATSIGGLPAASNPIIFAAGCSNVWAPELRWISNSWYLYYSADTGANGAERVHVAQSTSGSPLGPFAERGVLLSGYWNIDGNVFTSTNGKLYFVFSGSPSGTQWLLIAPMSSPTALSGTPVVISYPDQAWERNGIVNEGPFGFVRSNRVFIVYSASGCWTDDYALGLLTLTGPDPLSQSSWTKSGPVFTKQPGAYGPGHNGVFQDAAGQWWNIYHANKNPGEGCGGLRQIRTQRMAWSAGNVPSFGTPVPLGSWVNEDPDFLDARFALTESSGTNAANSVCGPGGVLKGAPVWMSPGLKLNGTTDYVECGAALGNDVQHAVTLAAWIRADAFSDWAGLITKGVNTSPYALQTWGDGSLRFSANWGGPAGGIGSGAWNSVAKMAVGQWYHVAIACDGAQIRFHINGQLDANQPAVALRFGVVNEPLVIGADLPGGDEFFNGTIRDARVYGRALSAAEINTIAGFTHAPVFIPVGDQAVLAGRNLLVTNVAADADAPPQVLTFSLLSGPSGATLNPSNGVFSWRPQMTQIESNVAVTVKADDNGIPIRSATQQFFVDVIRPASPQFQAVAVDEGRLRLDVTGDAGPDYLIYACSNLVPSTWSHLFTTNPTALPFTFWDASMSNQSQRYFRIELGP